MCITGTGDPGQRYNNTVGPGIGEETEGRQQTRGNKMDWEQNLLDGIRTNEQCVKADLELLRGKKRIRDKVLKLNEKRGNWAAENRREERDSPGKESGSRTRKDWNKILVLAEP